MTQNHSSERPQICPCSCYDATPQSIWAASKTKDQLNTLPWLPCALDTQSKPEPLVALPWESNAQLHLALAVPGIQSSATPYDDLSSL